MPRAPKMIRSLVGRQEYKILGDALRRREITTSEFVEQAAMLRDMDSARVREEAKKDSQP